MHFDGEVSISHDVEQLRQTVSELTNLHEAKRDHPWYVTDAPESYIEGQLRGIVGITLRITGIEAKAKLSQNRSVEDRMGVANDLRQAVQGDGQIAGMIDRSLL
ncbi:protease synthase and sporulation protein PAI 2 [mine drainage metagenome]|uniref:Protease synthase and sporulation protein PAI 2 n=1 Tax=mine drainage metagenome TaxID=410659 RepID=A0A1J5QIJ5_9ZZZZ